MEKLSINNSQNEDFKTSQTKYTYQQIKDWRSKAKQWDELNKKLTDSVIPQTDKENILQSLIENIADFLDSDEIKSSELLGCFKDPVKREDSELHIRMAKAAFSEYERTVVYTA